MALRKSQSSLPAVAGRAEIDDTESPDPSDHFTHWGRPAMAADPSSQQTPPHSETLTLDNVNGIYTTLLERMAAWRSQAPVTAFYTHPAGNLPFPNSDDLIWLKDTYRRLTAGHIDSGESETIALKNLVLKVIETESRFLHRRRRLYGQNHDQESTAGIESPPVDHPADQQYGFLFWPVPVITITALFLLTLQILFGVSRRELSFVLDFLKLLVPSVAQADAIDLSRICGAFDKISADPSTLISKVDIAPTFILYAACPTCSHLAPPKRVLYGHIYETSCQNLVPGDQTMVTCGEKLVVEKERRGPGGLPIKVHVPLKPFAYARLSDCIASYLSDRHLEASLVEAAASITASFKRPFDRNTVLHDIRDAQFIRMFAGPDGKTPFLLVGSSEMRLVFSLSVDWFHPRGSTRRSTVSLGVISMTCLNLPPDLRYSPEHMHIVGILPGPTEGNVQPYLEPLVDELLCLWEVGTQVPRTPLRPSGRLVRAVVVPVVCDMPAGRKVAGFNSATANISCPYCDCHKSEFMNAEVINGGYSTRRRSREEWLMRAWNWKNATSVQERVRLKKTYGISWSELLRLPYWDPTRHFVVDGMHSLFLGIFQNHVRKVWGVQEASKKTKTSKKKSNHGSGPTPGGQPPKPRKARPQNSATSSVGRPRNDIRGSEALLARVDDPRRFEKLERYNLAVLSQLCKTRGIVVVSTKRVTKQDYIRELEAHLANIVPDSDSGRGPNVSVAAPPQEGPTLSTPSDHVSRGEAPAAVHMMSPTDLAQVRHILSAISTPSWIGRMTKDFGSPTKGTPKADEWRSAATIQLPMALIKLWSGTSKQADLDWFLDLAMAINYATKRETSLDRSKQYLFHLRRYLLGLVDRGYTILPNHHAALHLAEFLPRFGPIRSWWTYPIERRIGILQKIKTNNRLGQLETTLLNRSHKQSRLRMLAHNCPPNADPVVRKMLDNIITHTQAQGRGTLLTDMSYDASKSRKPFEARMDHKKARMMLREDFLLLRTLLQSEGYPHTLSEKARQLRWASHGGVKYSVAHASWDHSNVIMRRADGKSFPAQITSIFVHERRQGETRRSETFAVARRYIRADEAEQKPFKTTRKCFDACVCVDAFFSKPVIVRLKDVRHHFASLSYVHGDSEGDRLVVWPINRD